MCDGVFFEDIYALGDFVRTHHASDVELGLDLAIYNKNRAFRLVSCSKVRDSARVLYLTAPGEEVSFEEWSRLLISAANADLDMLGEEDYPVVAVASSLEERERKRLRTSASCRRVPAQAFQLPVELVHAQPVLNWIEAPESGVFELLEGTNGAFVTEVRVSPTSEDIIYINCSRCAHRDPCYVQRKTKSGTASEIVHNSQNTFSLVVNVRTGLIFVNCLSEQCQKAVRFEKDLPDRVLQNVASNRAMAAEMQELELENAEEHEGQAKREDGIDQVPGKGALNQRVSILKKSHEHSNLNLTNATLRFSLSKNSVHSLSASTMGRARARSTRTMATYGSSTMTKRSCRNSSSRDLSRFCSTSSKHARTMKADRSNLRGQFVRCLRIAGNWASFAKLTFVFVASVSSLRCIHTCSRSQMVSRI